MHRENHLKHKNIIVHLDIKKVKRNKKKNHFFVLALKISRKKLVRVYNVHGLLKKIVVGNVRIKYQSYIFFRPLSMFHLLGEF
jgi:hypothetical protein